MGVTSHFTPELFDKELLWTRSICAKLWEIGRYDLGSALEQCRTRETYCLCQGCHKHMVFMNRCDRFYCPMCVSRLSFRRKLSVEFWAKEVREPKHIVLTIRNRNSISKTYVQFFKTALQRLRRTELFRAVRGGLYSLEVTNEGKGWHLHAHLLVDGPYIPAPHLSQIWARQVGQDFAIVALRDCREKSYLSEVTKYAVKGSQLSQWSGYDIAAFVDAFTGVRTFGVFGTLFKDRAKRAKLLEHLKGSGLECPHCANSDFWFLSDKEFEWFETTGQLPKYAHA